MQAQESTPPVLHYASDQPVRSIWIILLLRVLAVARVVLVPLLLVWFWYHGVRFRGTFTGFALHVLLIASIFLVGPFACILFLGVRRRYYLISVATTILVAAILIESYAVLEERLFIAEAKVTLDPDGVVMKAQRWWPNESSYMYYIQSSGHLHGGD